MPASILLFLLLAVARAEEPAAGMASLPVLVEEAPAHYPERAVAAGVEAEVLLEIEITLAGAVAGARVIRSSGAADFDDAALQAAHNHRFRPAVDAEGRPAPSRIVLLHRFTLDRVAVLSVEGVVRVAGTGTAVAGSWVVLEGASPGAGESIVLRALTDGEGRFRLPAVAPGRWRVTAAAPGLGAASAEVEVVEGRVATVAFDLVPAAPPPPAPADEEIVVVGQRLEPEVGGRALDKDEVVALPGSGGDIVRGLQNLPGVARAPFGAGQVMMRGTAPSDSAWCLGGVGLPAVFHFGGVSTAVSADVLGDVVFLPGAFGARYGRALGGVVDLRTRRELPEESRGYVSVDFFQSAFFVERRTGASSAYALSARRSYVDAVLAPFVEGETTASVRLPRYWDVQGRVLHRRPDGSTVDLLLLVSDDRLSITEEDGAEDGGDVESYVEIGFQKVWVQWAENLGGGWVAEQTFLAGPEDTSGVLKSEDEAWREVLRASARSELSRPVQPGGSVGWRFGFDGEWADESFLYDMEELDELYSYGGPESGRATISWPGLYLEQNVRRWSVDATPSLRFDAMLTSEGYRATALDPRFNIRLGPYRDTTLKASIGGYSQFPALRELSEDSFGNPDLTAERSVQATAGVERSFGGALRLDLTAWHSWLSDLVVGHEDRFELTLGLPPSAPYDTGEYANDGTGRAFGLESLVRFDTPSTLVWFGGAIGRSTRVKRPGGEVELFDYDQPVQLTLIASRELPRRWRVGARARYVSGNPYTPVANRYVELDVQEMLPVYAEADSARMPAYRTLDVRIDKEWPLRIWTLTTYLDLQNATWARNVEFVTWSPDWSEEQPVEGLPIVPAFGVKGEW